MAVTEESSHIDPIEHLKGVDTRVFEMTSNEEVRRGTLYDNELLHTNLGIMYTLTAEAVALYPDDIVAQEGYIRGAQVGMNVMRKVWAGKNLEKIVPFDQMFETEAEEETISDDDFDA